MTETTTTTTDTTTTTTTTTTEAPEMTDTTTTLDLATTTDEELVAAIVAAYVAGDTKIKSAFRTELQSKINSAVDTLDLAAMKINKAALDACLASSKIKSAPVVDHTAALADKINSLRVAADMLATFGSPTGEEIDFDRLADLTSGQVSESVVVAGWELAESTKIGSRKVAKGISLDAHLAEVVAAHEPGTFLSVAKIVAFKSEVAPNGLNSGGAVAARLNAEGGCTFDGVTVQPRVEGVSPLGVVID